MSARAHRTYSEEHLKILENNYHLMVANIDFIEFIGGGSTRCMLAEYF